MTLGKFFWGVLLTLSACAAYAEDPRLVVSGTGSASAAPDAASFQVGANVVRREAAAAIGEANGIVNAVKAVLDAEGIKDLDVRTARFQVAPQFTPRNRQGTPPSVNGYRVYHVLRVTTDQIDALGALIDKVLIAGANVLESIQYLHRTPEPLRDAARRAAVADAARRARVLADAAGKRLGNLRLIREGRSAGPIPARDRTMALRATATTVSPGQNRYQVKVTLEYSLD